MSLVGPRPHATRHGVLRTHQLVALAGFHDSAAHLGRILQRPASEDTDLLVICACPENHAVLEELKPLCDALYWKAEQGWDFSAYALGLSELARLSPGADVLAMNDSLF